MRINEVVKASIATIICEAEGKNTHLEHLEDHIFNKGFQGAKEAVDYLYSLHQMLEGNTDAPVSMTTKWDGAPAIIAGRDPQTGKFFVGTKGVFARNPKINFTDRDIEENHPAEGLQKKLKVALKYLEAGTNIYLKETGVYCGCKINPNEPNCYSCSDQCLLPNFDGHILCYLKK